MEGVYFIININRLPASVTFIIIVTSKKLLSSVKKNTMVAVFGDQSEEESQAATTSLNMKNKIVNIVILRITFFLNKKFHSSDSRSVSSLLTLFCHPEDDTCILQVLA